MPSPLRPTLATIRTIGYFFLACYLILQIGLALRALQADPAYLTKPAVASHDLPFLGINVEIDYHPANPTELEQQRQNFSALAADGFGWVRIEVDWDRIEGEPGHYQWQTIDQVIDAAVHADLVPVVVLNRSPQWARAPEDRTSLAGHLAPPADPADFAQFAATFAMRYGAQVRYYQIWHEPNIAPHWGARHIEPVAYAQLLAATASAIRDADADAQIISAALAPTADQGHLAIDEATFLLRLYAAGAAAHIDVVAVQPMGFGAPPNATLVGRAHLNFRRTTWIRGVMLAAGDGTTPILITRYGWNRALASPWATVSTQDQADFALEALTLAYDQWPWVIGQAWAIDQPTSAPADPLWGYSLTLSLRRAFKAWHDEHAGERRGASISGSNQMVSTQPATDQPTPSFGLLGGYVLLLGIALWRGVAAARQMTWIKRWGRKLQTSTWAHATAWLLLAVVYYFATWPPLILVCFLCAIWLAFLRPSWALFGALLLLPFYRYHKEILILPEYRFTLAPSTTLVLILLPAWLRRRGKLRISERMLARNDPALLFAWSWLLISLASVVRVWYLPGFLQGMIELVCLPLLLFAMVRTWAIAPQQFRRSVVALAVGGTIAALIGLVEWVSGVGTVVDGMRRLVGPSYSPNQSALYLVRTLPLLIVLGWVSRFGRLWQGASLMVLVALVLTGSRGGLLLGLPTALLILWILRPLSSNDPSRSAHRSAFQRSRWPLLVMTGGLCLLLGFVLAWYGDWTVIDRLTNAATITRRFDIWYASLALWRDAFWFGVGPGGYYWTFPAYIPMDSVIDPNLRHPHSIWLEITTQAGLIGLIWLVVALLWLHAKLRFHAKKHHPLQVNWLLTGLIAGLGAGFAHSQVDAWQALPELAGWNWAVFALITIAITSDSQS